MSEKATRLETLQFKPSGLVPDSCFPMLTHRAAVKTGAGGDLAGAIEETFRRRDWLNNWRVSRRYDYCHFHSTSREALGIGADASHFAWAAQAARS